MLTIPSAYEQTLEWYWGRLSSFTWDQLAMSDEAYFDYVLPAFTSTETVVMHVKIAFGCGLALFLVLLAYITVSCKMFYGAKAARRVMALGRILCTCACLTMIWMLDWSMGYDCLANRNSVPQIRFSGIYVISFIHHWPRPVIGLISIGCGLIGDLHPTLCIICVLGCLFIIFFNALSCVEITQHYNAVTSYGSPSGDYTKNGLLTYYWRDICGIAFSSASMFCMLQYLVIVGFLQPQLIPYDIAFGGEENRPASMRRDRMGRLQTQIVEGVKNGTVHLETHEEIAAKKAEQADLDELDRAIHK